jgi:hypothetical protein
VEDLDGVAYTVHDLVSVQVIGKEDHNDDD